MKSENQLIFEAYEEKLPTYYAQCSAHMSGEDVGDWKEAEARGVAISHGLCPHCYEQMMGVARKRPQKMAPPMHPLAGKTKLEPPHTQLKHVRDRF